MKYTLQFVRTLEQEDIPVRGNAMASGDAKLDRKVEDEILDRLDRGELEAWCCAKVEAVLQSEGGAVFRGVSYLGGCSYASEDELWKETAGEMEALAVEDLRREMKCEVECGKVAAKLLKFRLK